MDDPLFAEAAAADSAALAAAAGSAEEALVCHRDALTALAEGWRSESGCTATDVLQRHCAEATDIVAQLHRAAQQLTSLRDDWAELSGSVDRAAPSEPFSVAGAAPHREISAPPPSPPGPLETPLPPSTPVSAASWTMPAQAPQSWQSASVPALPDLGGALLGLVTQIARSLGSYADSPAPAPTPDAAMEHPEADPRPPHPQMAPRVKEKIPPAGAPKSASSKSSVPQQVPTTAVPTPAPPPPELLAAERLPDPVAPVVAPPVVTPPQPAPVPVPLPPPEPAVGPDAETPCEIAADELPKVGE